MLVQVEIQDSHIESLAATKLHGLVVMMLGWHAKGPGFESRSDLLKLFASQILGALYRTKRKEKKRREKV